MTLAIAKTPTNRWLTAIPFRFHSSLTDGMKDEIEAAIEVYERFTQARFKRRSLSESSAGAITFLRDDNTGGCGKSGIGRSTGPNGVSIRLKASCDTGTVLHEIGHAIGLFHEQQRPDRDDFITVNAQNIEAGKEGNFTKTSTSNSVTHASYDYGSIMHYDEMDFSRNGEPTIEAPHDVGQRDHLSPLDLATIRRLMPSNASTRTLAGDGKLGDELTRYRWTEGWSLIRAYRIDSVDYLFALKSGNGTLHFDRLRSDGTLGSSIQRENWKSGWNVAEFFRNGGDTFLFLLKSATGQVLIRRMKSNGKLGAKVYEDNWSRGWTAAAFYTVFGTDYGLFMKRVSGKIHIHKMNGGMVKERVQEKNLPGSKWNMALHFNQNLGVDNRMFFLRKDGKARVQEIAWDGKLGDVIKSYNWSNGWTTGVIYERDYFNKYLFLLKKSDGTVHIHRLNGNGTVGKRVDQANWSSGWSSATVVDNKQLMVVKEAGMTRVI
jgi:Astacin (Peptidase family M12A)